VFGVCAGMFVGCLAMALAEVLQVIPVFAKRIRLRTGKPTGKPKGMSPGIPVIVLAIALGKMAGSLFQMFLGW
ncbi:MAG: stage V sporulation protein AB, partial [Lachnospiraceae bacterium]|nr:stage V sporulation protein AB [Lachnospiraceae bacterium]